MIRVLCISMAALPTSALATAFDRPLPQAQSATAEFWFLIASLALIAALIAVGFLISRR